ncbi:MAG: class I SAM-dependent methyltransferase [Oscillospiraceae bacterium]|nr:class I SAM-dependent methyltransferase [Oscillospiraceae bacterium]
MIDFGCGRGNYAFGAAAAVGAEGIVYALDTDSDVLSFLKSEAEQRGVSNLYPMPSHEDASMDFPDASADAILIYDLIHVQALRARFLAESRRVLKPGGILSVLPFHMTEEEIQTMLAEIRQAGFSLSSSLENEGLHFDLHKVFSPVEESLAELERGTIYNFIRL